MLLTLFINMFILHMGTMEVRFMSISGVGNNYSFNASNIGNNSSSRVSGEQKKFNVDKEYKLQANSVLSTVRIETGESIGIFYDETSTKSNPVMLAKIIDADGSECEGFEFVSEFSGYTREQRDEQENIWINMVDAYKEAVIETVYMNTEL